VFGLVRSRAQSAAAEDVLHDIGANSFFSVDSRRMRRSPRTSQKCRLLPNFTKQRIGRLPAETTAKSGNGLIQRYVAKPTTNSDDRWRHAGHVGLIELGKIADILFRF
jgi:urease subunit alpha